MEEKKSFNEIILQVDEVKQWIDDNRKDLSKDDKAILRIKMNSLNQQYSPQKILIAILIASPITLFSLMTYVFWTNYEMLVMIDQKIAINSLTLLLSAENRLDILMKSLLDLKAKILSIKTFLLLIPMLIIFSVTVGLIIRYFLDRKKGK